MKFIEIFTKFFKFWILIPEYLSRRITQGLVFFLASLEIFLEMFDISKNSIVSRLFWGRGNTYRNFFHLFVLVITIGFVLTGLVSRIKAVNNTRTWDEKGGTIGVEDLLQQGGSIETVLARNPEVPGIKTKIHVVKSGETLQSIADDYGITMDTIRWASKNVLSPFTNEIEIGWELIIPEVNGVLYEVKPGDTIDSIIATASIDNTEANRFNVLEFNGLTGSSALTVGQKLFIPDGNLKTFDPGPTQGIPRGVFINPLTDSSCAGYTFSRGFLSYHNGVDLAHWPGCTIVAVANGYVTYAGWSNYGEGYNVRIYHGGGIETYYYHGDGTFWVKTGDRVQQGQPIMIMGNSGNSTGVHLHFSLFKDGYAVDPYGFVPY
jgi:murein DD-endopeptidase MepM/ murein hydrolase activator NlpD